MNHEEEIRVRAYRRAQRALADLKAATVEILATGGPEGLRNAQIGRLLGIYRGHVQHEGHVSRTILEMLQEDGIAEQHGKAKTWRLRQQLTQDEQD